MAEEQRAGQAKLRLQVDLESQTRKGLRAKLAEKERELTAATMALQEKDKMLDRLQSHLQAIRSKATSSNTKPEHSANFASATPLKQQRDWAEFQVHFAQIHPHFFPRLQNQFPNLNANDLRLCAYLRLHLSSKEIANLLHINHSSAQKARYRLKKKLGLSVTQSLQTFINKIWGDRWGLYFFWIFSDWLSGA